MLQGRTLGWTRVTCNQLIDMITAVVILEADDVILAQIGAGLHLDHLEGHYAGILQPVDRA